MAHTNKFQTFDPGASKKYRYFRDQHGRKWGCLTEGKDGHPVGTVEYHPQPPKWVKPPWLPDLGPKYLKVDVSADAFQGQLVILYGVLLDELLDAHRGRQTKAIEECIARDWKQDLIEVQKPKPYYSPQLVHILGPDPKPWQPVKAAMDGNPWILGATSVVDQRLVEFVKIPGKKQAVIELADFGPLAPEIPELDTTGYSDEQIAELRELARAEA